MTGARKDWARRSRWDWCATGPTWPSWTRTSTGPSKPPPPSALGRDALALACDVGREEQVERTVAAVLARFGAIDVLVNNAGITKRNRPVRLDRARLGRGDPGDQVGTFLMARWGGTWSPVGAEHREPVGAGGRPGGTGAGQRDLLRTKGRSRR